MPYFILKMNIYRVFFILWNISFLQRGAENYDSALQVLQKFGKSLQLATAYQRKGWNVHQQGMNDEAIKYFKKSLHISLVAGAEYQSIALQSMNSMGVTLTQLGQFEDAERYHFASLKRRQKILGENHPGVGACFNNIGIMYDQKGDVENAFKYFQKGLDVKLKSNAPIMSVVFSLSNTANMNTARGNFEQAHELLDDALMRLEKEKTPLREAQACTYDSKGRVYLKEGKLQKAEAMFQKAVNVREYIADNAAYMESLMFLAEVNKRSGKFKMSLNILIKALQLKDKATAAMPQNSFVAECYRCLTDVYNQTNDVLKYRETLKKSESELLRLERVYLCHCNERGLQRTRKQLADIQCQLDNKT